MADNNLIVDALPAVKTLDKASSISNNASMGAYAAEGFAPNIPKYAKNVKTAANATVQATRSAVMHVNEHGILESTKVVAQKGKRAFQNVNKTTLGQMGQKVGKKIKHLMKGGKAGVAGDVEAVANVSSSVNGASTVVESAAAGGTGATTAAAESVGTFAKVGKVAGKIATPLTVAASAFEVGSALKQKDGHKAANAAGSGAGALAGAEAGTVLIPIPIVGTIIGAIAGGIIGGKGADAVGGSWLHRKLNKNNRKEMEIVPGTNQLVAKGEAPPQAMAVNPKGELVQEDANPGAQGGHVSRLMQERMSRSQPSKPALS